MSEEVEVSADPAVKVARDLSAIERLTESLLGEAINKGSHRLMPGGPAMVALANVANLEAWENLNQETERYGRAYTFTEDEDPDEAWPPFQLIEFWSESWRRENGHEYDKRPTMMSETAYVRAMLDWAWDHEPGWDDMARDINRARVKLEDIVNEGRRVERSRIVCDACEAKPRLILAYLGIEDDRSDDVWKCPANECHKRFDSAALHRAHAKMLLSDKADRWVHQFDAISILKAQGRPERTVRQWLADGHGEGFCDPLTHEVWVWWPSLWTKHLVTPTRKRKEHAG